ncbi:uncharacterized protein [Ptychodera flava]|uniref:uncharacterized protein n=1 Tax=Ptychodera flava TaxID=63121 RepID=UPI00396AA727
MATYAYGNGTIRGNHLYSCIGRHENLELHVIANYESNGLSNGDYHTTGNTRVLIHGRCNRVPIVLVFASYKPVNWILDFADPEVIISKVLLISSFVDRSFISHQHGRVTNIERSDQLPWGYGDDSEAGDTVGLLKYLMGRFGHVTSFSGTLKADKWELKLISEDIALDVTTTGPELEDCWSGEQCNSCKQDYVGAINNIPVCCPGCRVPRFVFVLTECLCQVEQIPDEPCVPNVTDMTNETTTGRDLADTGRDQACWIGEQCAPCAESVIERYNDTLVCCPQCGADGCYCDVILLKDTGPVSTGVSQNASLLLQYVINVCVLIVVRTELFTSASEVMV